ncbi:hypothetical protein [Dickeya fangzhongdai]|uniref:hypothetical protein n=1 Tax=Dickeya fangzhongdai TaxID=1778540 RepID=UPI001ADB6E2D|nr:hypothetical protein [Dickeya fangzhongdai]MBO8135305.1 hypothetical protein [Dickeya fangzhongdai]
MINLSIRKILFISALSTISLFYQNTSSADGDINTKLTYRNERETIKKLANFSRVSASCAIKKNEIIPDSASSTLNSSMGDKKDRCIQECLYTLPTGSFDGGSFHSCMAECMGMIPMCDI